ncbi:amidohydrolase family protein [Paraburkholderia nemoris]|uniref:amidohydrolase family protein n=1 Tax=Paraburkholderia nemoris TaxID=2793076 RepID=UPI0038BDD168
MSKIDIFNHILPEGVYDELKRIAPNNVALRAFKGLPELWDMDRHFSLMDEFGDYQQILSLSNPPIEMLGSSEQTPKFAEICNNALAVTCERHPDRFPGFIASLPMNNPDAVVREARRCIGDLGARGVQIFSNVLGAPLSEPCFYGLFEYMASVDLPVWIHPMRGANHADYSTEETSKNEIWFTFGWPYETSAAVTRLIFSGIFDKLPDLKIITHHGGGMIPFYSQKIALGFSQIFEGDPERNPAAVEAGLRRPLIDYYRMLYADTALNGSAAATRCSHDFFGTGHMLFATDAPFDARGGRQLVGSSIAAVEALPIDSSERERIFSGNARALLKLD